MEHSAKIGLAALQLAPAKPQTRLERYLAAIRRTRRLLAQAVAAKRNMNADYGTDVTSLSSDEYKARIRRQMMRG